MALTHCSRPRRLRARRRCMWTPAATRLPPRLSARRLPGHPGISTTTALFPHGSDDTVSMRREWGVCRARPLASRQLLSHLGKLCKRNRRAFVSTTRKLCRIGSPDVVLVPAHSRSGAGSTAITLAPRSLCPETAVFLNVMTVAWLIVPSETCFAGVLPSRGSTAKNFACCRDLSRCQTRAA